MYYDGDEIYYVISTVWYKIDDQLLEVGSSLYDLQKLRYYDVI